MGREVTKVTREPGTTIAEKLGAASGAWAAVWLLVHYLILQGAVADPGAPAADYVRTLLAERMRWEWATALRVMAGIMIVWFMGSLGGRLRMAEGEPGRLASIGFGIGVIWGAIFLFSAMFNSVGIVLAAQYQLPEAARLVGILADQIMYILTPSLVFTLTLAVSFVTLRFGGFPRAYAYGTTALTAGLLGLTIVDWYGPGNLGTLIMAASLAWLAVTSFLLIPAYRPPDIVRGAR
jgi:hypothetical protein